MSRAWNKLFVAPTELEVQLIALECSMGDWNPVQQCMYIVIIEEHKCLRTRGSQTVNLRLLLIFWSFPIFRCTRVSRTDMFNSEYSTMFGYLN